MKHLRRALLVAVPLLAASIPLQAWAQAYPSKPITIVVPFSAGAGTDLIARLLAEKLSARVGQPVVVENRVGAAGVIGTAHVAKAANDGHTLLFTPSSIAFAQQVTKTAPGAGYDPINGFAPIIEVGTSPVFLVTGADSGFKSFKDVAVAAKTRKLDFGSAGPGSILHIIGEVVNKATSVNFVHVPYKGVAPAVADVLGGHIPFAYGSLSTIKPFLASGKLVPLAVTSRERSQLAPEVPSIAELGYKGVDLSSWYGLYGPRGMPAEAVKLLNEQVNAIIRMPDVIERMAAQGSAPVGGPPERLRATNAADVELYSKIITDLNIKAE